ncbi:MAG: ABC transporter substrate binding protein [Gammaproteobacteria bacterium]
MFNKQIVLRLAILLILLSISGTNSIAAETKTILIVSNAQSSAYQDIITGFKETLSTHANVELKTYILSALENKTEFINTEIKIIEPDLIFALGTASTKIALQATQQIPIITTMLVKTEFLQQASNVTGVVLTYPLATQFQWLKKVLPNLSHIAILYNINENQNTINRGTNIAHEMGLKISAIPVESARQLPYALKQLTKNIQVLLAIPDRVTMSTNTAKAVLLASFRNRIPMIGLTDNWVKAGAFYALSWNYLSIGKQCGDQAINVLNGKSIKRIPIVPPSNIEYSINKTVAERMNIELSSSLLNNAKIVFK